MYGLFWLLEEKKHHSKPYIHDEGVCSVKTTILTLTPTSPFSYLPPGQPHHIDIGPVDWFYSLVIVLVGSCPSGELS